MEQCLKSYNFDECFVSFIRSKLIEVDIGALRNGGTKARAV